MTKNQFVKQGNAICESGLQRVKGSFADAAEIERMSRGEQEEMIRGLVPPFQSMLDELAELSAPKADQREIDRILRSFEQALDTLDTEPERGLAGEYVFTNASNAASKYGLIECVP